MPDRAYPGLNQSREDRQKTQSKGQGDSQDHPTGWRQPYRLQSQIDQRTQSEEQAKDE